MDREIEHLPAHWPARLCLFTSCEHSCRPACVLACKRDSAVALLVGNEIQFVLGSRSGEQDNTLCTSLFSRDYVCVRTCQQRFKCCRVRTTPEINAGAPLPMLLPEQDPRQAPRHELATNAAATPWVKSVRNGQKKWRSRDIFFLRFTDFTFLSFSFFLFFPFFAPPFSLVHFIQTALCPPSPPFFSSPQRH